MEDSRRSTTTTTTTLASSTTVLIISDKLICFNKQIDLFPTFIRNYPASVDNGDRRQEEVEELVVSGRLMAIDQRVMEIGFVPMDGTCR